MREYEYFGKIQNRNQSKFLLLYFSSDIYSVTSTTSVVSPVTSVVTSVTSVLTEEMVFSDF